MKRIQKMLAVAAVLAMGLLAGCGASGAGSTASSTVVFTGAVQPNKQVPLEDIATGTYKFAANITAVKDGQVTLDVCSYDIYEKALIDKLKVGDLLNTHLDGADKAQDITVESIERDKENGFVSINGGVEQGGVDLRLENDFYRTFTMDDYPVYYKLGELTMPLADNVTIEDSSADPQASAVEINGAAAVEETFNADPDYWVCGNTTVFTDNGAVNNIVRIWVP